MAHSTQVKRALCPLHKSWLKPSQKLSSCQSVSTHLADILWVKNVLNSSECIPFLVRIALQCAHLICACYWPIAKSRDCTAATAAKSDSWTRKSNTARGTRWFWIANRGQNHRGVTRERFTLQSNLSCARRELSTSEVFSFSSPVLESLYPLFALSNRVFNVAHKTPCRRWIVPFVLVRTFTRLLYLLVRFSGAPFPLCATIRPCLCQHTAAHSSAYCTRAISWVGYTRTMPSESARAPCLGTITRFVRYQSERVTAWERARVHCYTVKLRPVSLWVRYRVLS